MFEMRPYTHRGYRGGYDPFRELENFERFVFGAPLAKPECGKAFMFRTDVTDEGDSFSIKADLPGFDKSDIAIDIEGDTLKISAERKAEVSEDSEAGKYIRRERTYGKFSRSFDISSVKADDIKAAYENGVLTITLPKKESALPQSRRLEIG